MTNGILKSSSNLATLALTSETNLTCSLCIAGNWKQNICFCIGSYAIFENFMYTDFWICTFSRLASQPGLMH